MAGGAADGAAQRAGVSPVSLSHYPSTPWLNLGIITFSLSSPGHCLAQSGDQLWSPPSLDQGHFDPLVLRRDQL